MERNKYIKVIDHYARLLTEHAITSMTAWWGMQAVILCAVKDDRLSADDYLYILEYRDTFFE